MEELEESDTEDQTDNIQNILCEEPDFSSIKSNDIIQDCEVCQECDKPILTENPPRSLILNVCGDIVHRTYTRKPDKRGVLECSCGMADDKDPSLSSEEMDMDEKNNEDGKVESTLPEETDSASNSKSKKQANEDTDSSASKKSKKCDLDEDFNILKRLIRELSSDTTQISVIKEKKGFQRESMQEDRSIQIFFDLYFKITNAEEEEYKEHEALKKLYDEVKDQLPKEVTKNAIQKKSNRARKVYDLFFHITNNKIQRMVFIGRIKSFSATSILNLSDDNIRYVAFQ
ncbi:9325_t:CDS:2, partial [Funneliformis mosseae]